jgi:hypothetical protein
MTVADLGNRRRITRKHFGIARFGPSRDCSLKSCARSFPDKCPLKFSKRTEDLSHQHTFGLDVSSHYHGCCAGCLAACSQKRTFASFPRRMDCECLFD